MEIIKEKLDLSVGKKTIRMALAGNPNCGKTTLFNRLTGSNQYVGNWPGVTVEKKEGRINYPNRDISVIDLPGIYSLSPYTPEEIVSRNCLLYDDPDVIINIVDATNIERNLYLSTQILELDRPMVIALNMVDILEKKGDKIDCEKMALLMGVPIIPISASKNTGVENLIGEAIKLADSCKLNSVKNIYSKTIDKTLTNIEDALGVVEQCKPEHGRWTAVKLFEGDKVTWNDYSFTEEQEKHIKFHIDEIPTSKNVDREMIIADQRYKYICDMCKKTVVRKHAQGHVTLSDKIDSIVTNKYMALPLFLIMMLFVFFVTFGPLGTYLKDLAEWLITDVFSGFMSNVLVSANASYWAQSLVVDGIIAGVGAVVSFLPQIMLLFTLLSVLEDSGYMARAAFIMDKLLRMIGLSGKAFVPMLMGFGCTVPAVLGTRTLENEKDKRLTILITPFMSCSAKMPVYLLFVSAFFPKNSPLIIFSIYIFGMIIAVLTALLFKNTLLKGDKSPFVMELPPYRLPTPKSLCLHVWERLKDFLIRAGTVLMGATIIIWFLQSFDLSFNWVTDSSNSILAEIGKAISPIFAPCGFGNWKASVSLVTGLAAKESVVSTMTVLFGGSASAIASAFTPLSAYAFMVFVLLYTPCIAALSAIHREMCSTKWTVIAVCYQLLIAWVMATLVFQIGTLIGNII